VVIGRSNIVGKPMAQLLLRNSDDPRGVRHGAPLAAVSTKARFRRFLARKEYQPSLSCNRFPKVFQADDEGSIPFTRSNLFKGLARPIAGS
jgi:hypothetical protein